MTKIIFLMCILQINQSVYSLTIDGALSKIEKNEKINKAIAEFERSDNNITYQLSNIFPNINLIGNYSKLGPGTGLNEKDTSLFTLNLVQPLFRGLREFKTIEATKLVTKSKSLLVDATKREIKSILISEYFSLLSSLEDKRLTLELLKLSKERVSEIEGRVKIGKSKKADLFTARSQEYSAQNSLAEIDTQIQKNLMSLNYLLDAKLTEADFSRPVEVKNIEKISKYSNLPTLRSYELLKEAAKLNLKIAKAGHLPSVDLKANYYPHQNNLSSQRDWDASVVLTLPLYEGGKTNSDVSDKALAINQAHYEYVMMEKSVSQAMDNIILDFDSSRSRLSLLSKSKKAAKESYVELRKEYNLGLVTNLDVIQSLNQFIDTEKNYSRVFHNYQSSAYRYKVLTENL